MHHIRCNACIVSDVLTLLQNIVKNVKMDDDHEENEHHNRKKTCRVMKEKNLSHWLEDPKSDHQENE